MGQFSWRYSDTDKPMLDDVVKDSYLLVPNEFINEFGSHHIKETCYDGYGRMGGYDIYDLVVYWNKEWIVKNPDYVKHRGSPLKKYRWYDIIVEAVDIHIPNFEQFKKFIEDKLRETDVPMAYKELRIIGIDIACYDEDNENLENPIKIVEGFNLIYNQAYPSVSDPNQGWGDDDDDDDEWFDED